MRQRSLACFSRSSWAVRRLVSHREERLVKRYGCGLDVLAFTGTAGRQLHYPVGSAPGCRDVRWRLFYPQRPGDAAAVFALVIASLERDVTLSL